MVKILFERRQGVYLPEIDAYCTYLRQHYPQVTAIDSALLPQEAGFDVIWKFMGFDRNPPAPTRPFTVHEYGSLSVPPLARLKNAAKRFLNSTPDQRVFLTARVEADFGFTDSVPSFRRDMGVDEVFFTSRTTPPEFDFVYAGSLYRGTLVLAFLEAFAANPKAGTLLVVGDVRAEDQTRLAASGRIHFTGRVPYRSVVQHLHRARFALNLIPDVYPFNLQTATKVLDYAAAGLPILSNRYFWAEAFAAQRQAQFFWLPKDLAQFSLAEVERFAFKTPDVSDLRWDAVIRASKVFDFLDQKRAA